MSENRSYYAIIPANVRYDKRLPANAKLLYGEITALCNEKGFCWAGDKYFADLYGVSKVSIQKWLKALHESGYITKELIYKEGSKEILHRYIRLVVYPIQEKLSNPTQEKFRDNNTSINNTINNTVNNDDDALKEIFKLYEKTFGVLNSINVQSGMATLFLTKFIRCHETFLLLLRLPLKMSLLGSDASRQMLKLK